MEILLMYVKEVIFDMRNRSTLFDLRITVPTCFQPTKNYQISTLKIRYQPRNLSQSTGVTCQLSSQTLRSQNFRI